MRILFMGTPEIAATCMEYLLSAGETVVGAVTREDKPKGRGGVLTPPPVKRLALTHGIPVYQPKTLRDEGFLALLREIDPDVIVVVAYGRILPPDVLSYPRYGCVNLHVSLLPAYRGAAPMQRAVMNGERVTGVTTMLMDAGLDTGDILFTEQFQIGDTDTFETVHDTSAALGGSLLLKTLHALRDGTAVPKKQDESGASYADKIEKSDCVLDFSRTATALSAQIRGLYPFPLAFTHTPDGRLLKVCSAVPAEGKGACGEVIRVSGKGDGEVVVACGEGALSLRILVPEGKGKMTAGDLVRGRRISEKDILS